MGALAKEEYNSNFISIDEYLDEDVNQETPQYSKGKNYNITRYSVARNGEVEPIRDVKDIQAISEYFYNKKKYRDWCLFNLGIARGFRASDLLRFRVEDVSHLVEGKLVVNETAKVRFKEKKTGKYRDIVIGESTMKIVAEYIRLTRPLYHSWLFPSQKGSSKNSLRTNGGVSFRKVGGKESNAVKPLKQEAAPKKKGDPIDVDTFGQIMRKAQKDLGLPYKLGTHSCRKTFGYQFMMNHKDDQMALAWLQHSLNHSNQAITLHYIGLNADVDREYYSNIDYGVDCHCSIVAM